MHELSTTISRKRDLNIYLQTDPLVVSSLSMADQLLGSWLNESWKRVAMKCSVTLWFIWLINGVIVDSDRKA